MFASETEDPAPVPEGPAREEPAVGHPLPFVVNDRIGDVPALPAGLRGAVAEVDVLAVEAEAGVEPADLSQHRATQEHEAAEHPVGLHGGGRVLAEVVVRLLLLEWRSKPTERRSPYERPANCREAPSRRDELAVETEHARAGDAAIGMRFGKSAERRDGARF